MAEARLLGRSPAPIWLVTCEPTGPYKKPGVDLAQLLTALEKEEETDRSLLFADFRGVSVDRLSTVLLAGIDVEPTDAPIYVSSGDKAAEYGDWPKVLLALKPDALLPTWKEISASLPVSSDIRNWPPDDTRN